MKVWPALTTMGSLTITLPVAGGISVGLPAPEVGAVPEGADGDDGDGGADGALGADGLWWALPLSNIVTAGIAGALFLWGPWKTRRLTGRPSLAVRQEVVEEQAQM